MVNKDGVATIRIDDDILPLWDAIKDKRRFIRDCLLHKLPKLEVNDLALLYSKEDLDKLIKFSQYQKNLLDIEAKRARLPYDKTKFKFEIRNIQREMGILPLTCVHCGNYSDDPKVEIKPEGYVIRICPNCTEPDPADSDNYFHKRGRVLSSK